MKIELTLLQIMTAFQALTVILQQKGIPFKTNYWLKRNQDHLSGESKAFNEVIRKKFEEAAMDAPGHSFIPPDKYEQFKEGLLGREISDLKGYLISYEEVMKKGQKFLPKEMMDDFQQQINRDADEIRKSVEYTPIPVPSEEAGFEEFIKSAGLPGSVIGDIWWMLNIPEEDLKS